MDFKQLICPACGGSIQIDDSKSFGFCSYCGSKIQLAERFVVKHSGNVAVDTTSVVNGLCKKGFQEIDRNMLNEASITFNKAAEYDCEKVEVVIGKMLTCPIYDHRKNVCRTKFDKYYFNLLKSKFDKISEQEILLINKSNCNLFLKCYLFFDDKDRANYVMNKFPNSLSLEVFSSDHIANRNYNHNSFISSEYCFEEHREYINNLALMLKENRNINIIDCLLEHGFTPESIFKCLHNKAYDLKCLSKYSRNGKHIFYMYEYHLCVIPFHVFKQLVSAGLSLDTKITFLKPYNNDGYIEHTVQSVPISKFFLSHDLLNHIHFNSSLTGTLSRFQDFIRQESTSTGSKKRGCYVATCVYGSYDCPEVWILRRYRDFTLYKTWYGKIFIHLYYFIGPKLVGLFGDSLWVKSFWKRILDKIVTKLQKQGVQNTPYKDRY